MEGPAFFSGLVRHRSGHERCQNHDQCSCSNCNIDTLFGSLMTTEDSSLKMVEPEMFSHTEGPSFVYFPDPSNGCGCDKWYCEKCRPRWTRDLHTAHFVISYFFDIF
ncbi:hypothetical protein M758_11G053900 [Ceratodon purpureus]|nr:hypothetical protein M758_11G053900 [Ceratodon purpureus]